MAHWHGRVHLVVLLLGAAAVLSLGTGCQSAKQAGPPEKVTIAYTVSTGAAVADVAQMRGFYREEGLEVAVRLHPYGKPALQDVLDGKADFATLGETPIVFAVMKGDPVSIIATIQMTNLENAIVARKDRGIGAMGDLRGRKIATSLGTTLDYFLDAILGAKGISRKEVTVIDMKVEELSDALARGDVDAISTFHPYIIPAQKNLGDRGITFRDKDIYTATFNMIAKQEFIRRNPEKIKKILRALIKAEEFLNRHPAEAQKIVADFSGADISIVREVWAGYNFGVGLDQSLLLAMEDESKWAIKNRLTGGMTKLPNYLDFIYLDGLASVKPKAINILR